MNNLFKKLGRFDLKLIGRDTFLLFMFGFIIWIIVIMRFGLPWLNNYLMINGILPSDTIIYNLEHFYPLIIGYLALFQGSMISGVIFGFMTLDEKDNRTIKAMLVTPIKFSKYVTYKLTVASVTSFFIVFAMVFFINQALVPLWKLILLSFGAALTSPIALLFLAVFADDKVQGFAYSKFTGIAGMLIIVAWFVSEPFQWLFGLFPPFWISKAYWMAFNGNSFWWIALTIGIISQLGLIAVLMKQFNKTAYK